MVDLVICPAPCTAVQRLALQTSLHFGRALHASIIGNSKIILACEAFCGRLARAATFDEVRTKEAGLVEEEVVIDAR
jgi:hypothetical protein